MIELLIQHGGDILWGLLGTIMIVSGGFLVGTPAGIVLAFFLISQRWLLRWPARTFVELIRNTPFLIQAMLLFAALGVLRIRIDPKIGRAHV